MFCQNCGKQIPDESVFCSECGNKCSGNINKNVDMPKKHKSAIIKALINPISTMKHGVLDLSLKVELIYITIITLLIPLIKTFTFKAYSFNFVKSIIDLACSFSNENKCNLNEIMHIKNQFNIFMENLFPTGQIYFLNLGSYLINYVVIIGIIFIVFKLIIKENLNKGNIVNIVFVISMINIVLTIICTISLILGGTPWILMSIFSAILSLSLLYSGFSNIIKSSNKFVYIFSIACMIAYIINIYFVYNNIYSIVSNVYYNGLSYFL